MSDEGAAPSVVIIGWSLGREIHHTVTPLTEDKLLLEVVDCVTLEFCTGHVYNVE